MGISTFPAPSGGGETNDFILDKNGTTNTDFAPGRSFAAGGYSVVVTGSTAYDIYLLDSSGSSVGYTNGTSIVASGAFESLSVLGLGTADTIAFTYNGPSTNATTTGQETGAGAFLTSITPSDLPSIDDTAIVAGGNFASNVEISFISGTVTKAAKNVVVGSSTALVVTRPDDLIEDLAPYDLKAINPGITEPTSSGANILSGTVTVGTDPSFVTTSPILGAFPGSAFSTAILTSDTEGSVVAWAITAGELPAGLTLGTADGSISGTVAGTASGTFNFTVQITDDGQNTNSASFDLPVGFVISGTNATSTAVGGTSYAFWTTTGDLEYLQGDSTSVEYILIAGGGGGGNDGSGYTGGGGGAGGLLFGTATLTGNGTATVTLGAGGASSAKGNDTIVSIFGTAFAGGDGGDGGFANGDAGGNGGSGGGGGAANQFSGGAGGLGTAGQGNNGFGFGSFYNSGGGGGAGAASTNNIGGAGADYGAWATAINLIFDGGYFAGGGSGAGISTGEVRTGGIGGGGDGGAGTGDRDGDANSGGGGGGAKTGGGFSGSGGLGGSGLVIARWT